MEEAGGHLDRQPPRDDEEAAEQDRLIDEPGGDAPTELPTDAADPDVATGSGDRG